jgi:hypothetical protein
MSPAKALYVDNGGFATKIDDYEKGYFDPEDTAKIPVNNRWDRNAKDVEKTHPKGHVIFGHFPRRADEPAYEDGGDWKAEAFVFLTSYTKQTLEELGFNVLFQKMDSSVTTGFLAGGGFKAYALQNDALGCRIEDQCRVSIKFSQAHFAKAFRTSRSTYQNAPDDHRVMKASMDNFIHFQANASSTFDQRTFYQTLSKNMPEGMFIYLNASPYAYVQINAKEVVGYPYLLNQGKVLMFELPPKQ